ncbi:plasmid mobilization protein [Marinilabilia salmonicolor]|uniref:plasmid mobilization protein n=1 Tax=Marinilabilia salmonicolor TaxID=989 RepID=UPI00029A955B|nr:plasmid mobilization relaxosome protein MobC [Marinilabilia salmonicolor]
MARPKKEIEELRIHQVNIRLTDIEREYAEKQAELSGLTVAKWLRRAAFSKRPLVLSKVTPMHRAYYKQLVGISTNINQIAKNLNQGKYTKIFSGITEANVLLRQIARLLTDDRKTN